MIKKYHGDGEYILKWDLIFLSKNLSYDKKPNLILDQDFWIQNEQHPVRNGLMESLSSWESNLENWERQANQVSSVVWG